MILLRCRFSSLRRHALISLCRHDAEREREYYADAHAALRFCRFLSLILDAASPFAAAAIIY